MDCWIICHTCRKPVNARDATHRVVNLVSVYDCPTCVEKRKTKKKVKP